MTQTQTAPSSHLSVCLQTESKLTARQVPFTFEPNLAIEKIRDAEGNQVRLSEHRAPKAMVARYSAQMKAGAIFPAIVLNDHHELIDGNTRWAAAQANNKQTIAAYICSGLTALEARSLSVELNQSHGLSMTEEEIRAFLTNAVQEGQVLDPRAYSRMTGVKVSTIARWVAAKHFEIRAADQHIDALDLERLSTSVRAALNVAKLTAVFRAATTLAIDARVPAAQLKPIIAQANAAPSEAQALAVIAAAYDARSDEVKAHAAGFKRARRRSSGAAPHIGGLLRFDVSDLIDVAPERQPDTFARMRLLRERLDGALALASAHWDIAHPAQGEGAQAPSRDLAAAR